MKIKNKTTHITSSKYVFQGLRRLADVVGCSFSVFPDCSILFLPNARARGFCPVVTQLSINRNDVKQHKTHSSRISKSEDDFKNAEKKKKAALMLL